MFNSDTSGNVYAADAAEKLQHTILEQQSDKAMDLVLRTFLRMCEPKQSNFWERSPMASSSCYAPLPEEFEKFADEHREEFQAWLKSKYDRPQNDTD